MAGLVPLLWLVLLSLSLGFVLAFVALRVLRFTTTSLPSTVESALSVPLIRRHLSSCPGFAAFLRARFSPTGKLGLHLTLGVTAGLLLVSALWGIGEGMESRHAAVVDSMLLDIAYRARTPLLTEFFVLVTFLGSRGFVAPASVFVGFALLIMRRRMLLMGYVAVVIGGDMLNRFLKAIYMRARPAYEQVIDAGGWSFPSGHAMTAIVFYGVLVYLLLVLFESKRARTAGIAIGFALVLLVGMSRVYLGVHYSTDVIAGYLAGLLWLTVCATVVETFRR